MADPVEAKSTFLCMYMSNHPDTLVAYVKYWGKVNEQVTSAKMTSIDSKGMNLEYEVKESNTGKKSVRVSFDPPLSGYEEVKPRLLSMTADAQESLGMSPQITSFEIPLEIYKAGLAISFLIYTSISSWYTGSQWEVGQWLFATVGYRRIKRIWVGTAIVHFFEASYALRLCLKHNSGFFVALCYFAFTFVFGYNVLGPLRRKIHKARIDSITKGN